jgi:hypothetical protein
MYKVKSKVSTLRGTGVYLIWQVGLKTTMLYHIIRNECNVNGSYISLGEF